MVNNVFEILAIRGEAPNDAMVAWLCDPRRGHGIADFAASIVRELWGIELQESILGVQRQCSLARDCRPDITVRFAQSLLVIENKVNVSALRPDQIQAQHQLGTSQQQGRPFYHVLLCPDRFQVEAFCVASPNFRVLRYGQLAQLLADADTTNAPDDARLMARQYAEFVRLTYAASAPTGIRLASSSMVADRVTRTSERAARGEAWSPEEFMEQVERVGSPELQRKQSELLGLLYEMETVDPRFDRRTEQATYRVYLAETELCIFKVFADGALRPIWGYLQKAGYTELVAAYRLAVEPLTDSLGGTFSYLRNSLVDTPVEDVVRLLQSVADKARVV